MEMNYCMQCGTKLVIRHHETEGEVPYCESCGEFRYPVFNTAVSMIVMDEARERIIHILSSLDTARITISHDWDFLTRVSTSYLAMEHGHVQTCAPTFQHVHAHPWGDAPHAH